MSNGPMSRSVTSLTEVIKVQGIDREEKIGYGYYIDKAGRRRFKKFKFHIGRHDGKPKIRKPENIKEDLYFGELSRMPERFNSSYSEFIQEYCQTSEQCRGI